MRWKIGKGKSDNFGTDDEKIIYYIYVLDKNGNHQKHAWSMGEWAEFETRKDAEEYIKEEMEEVRE